MTATLFQRHQRIGIDSNVLIYLLEGTGPLAAKSAELLDAIAMGAAQGVLATLALAEVCAGPARQGESALVELFADELASLENVTVVPLTADLAVDAATISGARTLAVGDAIHLATARAAGATVFVTNDRRIKPINGLGVAYLDDL